MRSFNKNIFLDFYLVFCVCLSNFDSLEVNKCHFDRFLRFVVSPNFDRIKNTFNKNWKQIETLTQFVAPSAAKVTLKNPLPQAAYYPVL